MAIAGEAEIAVLADRERMKQLLLILIDNAVKYTPAGGRVGVPPKRAGAKALCYDHRRGYGRRHPGRPAGPDL